MPRRATIFEFVIGLRSETGTQYHLSHLFCNPATTGPIGQQQLLSCKYRIIDVLLTSPARFSAVPPVSPVSVLELKRLGGPWAANLPGGDHALVASHRIRSKFTGQRNLLSRTGSAVMLSDPGTIPHSRLSPDTATRISCLLTRNGLAILLFLGNQFSLYSGHQHF
jgi:hypothetical protein